LEEPQDVKTIKKTKPKEQIEIIAGIQKTNKFNYFR
jgi:hypothetical protein